MNTYRPTPRLIALITLAAIFLFVRDAVFAQQPPSMEFRPALLELSAGNYSYSTKADLLHDGVVGGAAVHHTEFSLSGRHELKDGLQLAYGLAYDTNFLPADAPVPLPDNLTALSLNLGVIRKLDADWTVALFARPGFYSDFKQLGSRSFNMPVLLTANWSAGPGLNGTFALSYDRFSRYPLLPVPGVHWAFAPAWNLELGFPRTAVTWQANERLALHLDAGFQGGSYRVNHAPAALPALAGTLLDYREIRAGAGLDFNPTDATTFSLDAGFVPDRRFDYHESHYRLDGKVASYVKVSFRAHF
jgi:hypothetical protein